MVNVEASFARFEQQAQQDQQAQQAQQAEEDGLQGCVVSHEIKCHEMCFGVVVAELNEKLKRWKRIAAEKAKEEAEMDPATLARIREKRAAKEAKKSKKAGKKEKKLNPGNGVQALLDTPEVTA